MKIKNRLIIILRAQINSNINIDCINLNNSRQCKNIKNFIIKLNYKITR